MVDCGYTIEYIVERLEPSPVRFAQVKVFTNFRSHVFQKTHRWLRGFFRLRQSLSADFPGLVSPPQYPHPRAGTVPRAYLEMQGFYLGQ